MGLKSGPGLENPAQSSSFLNFYTTDFPEKNPYNFGIFEKMTYYIVFFVLFIMVLFVKTMPKFSIHIMEKIQILSGIFEWAAVQDKSCAYTPIGSTRSRFRCSESNELF